MIYYNVMLKSFWKRFGVLGLMMFSFGAFAQDAELGMEYMKAGEYEKAKTVFSEVGKKQRDCKSYSQTIFANAHKIKRI